MVKAKRKPRRLKKHSAIKTVAEAQAKKDEEGSKHSNTRRSYKPLHV
jgi:hypothetical protein